MNLFSLEGKTALVTGAGSGIGQQLSIALAEAGAKLILQGRQGNTLKDTEKKIKKKVRLVCNDLLLIEKWEEFAQDNDLHEVDILINAAGINLRQPWDEVDNASWNETLDINLKVPFFLSRTLFPTMKKRNWGRVINIASLQSQRAFSNSMPYGASKGGIAQLTRAMAEGWSESGVNCNAIAPGFFPTKMTAPVLGDMKKSSSLAEQTAIKRNGELSDLNGTCIFLASHASDYVTGQVIFVDGGFTAK